MKTRCQVSNSSPRVCFPPYVSLILKTPRSRRPASLIPPCYPTVDEAEAHISDAMENKEHLSHVCLITAIPSLFEIPGYVGSFSVTDVWDLEVLDLSVYDLHFAHHKEMATSVAYQMFINHKSKCL